MPVLAGLNQLHKNLEMVDDAGAVWRVSLLDPLVDFYLFEWLTAKIMVVVTFLWPSSSWTVRMS